MQIQRYVGKISGPLMDRIDIHIDVPAVKFNELRGRSPEGDSSETIRERVIRAREVQLARFNGDGVYSNSAMSPKQIRTPLLARRDERRAARKSDAAPRPVSPSA